MNYLDLSSISAYNRSFKLANYIWDIAIKWDYFSKKTIGLQLVRSTDSISANIAEGFGRYTKKDKINFYRYSFGSLKETQDWIEKAKVRNLISAEDYLYINSELKNLPRELYQLIHFTNEKLQI
ncbi:MAG: four helix bundle protein [Weeksellaceae bacterium]